MTITDDIMARAESAFALANSRFLREEAVYIIATAIAAERDRCARVAGNVTMRAEHDADKAAMFLPDSDPSERLWRLYAERAGNVAAAIRNGDQP